MNKLLTKVAKLVLGLSLAAGVGVAVGSQKASRVDAADTKVSFTAGTNAAAIKVNYNSAGAPASNNGVRLGTSKNAGSATFTIPSGTTTFGFYAVGWKDKSVTATISASVGTLGTTSVSLTANSAATGTISAGATVAITGTDNDCKKEINISNVTASSTITITATTSEKRLIAWDAYYVTANTAVTGVTVSPTEVTLGVGATQQLTPTVSPSNATNKTVSYSSSATGVATVSSSGLITAVAAGNATITVTTQDGNKTATCAVTVTAPISVSGVTLNKNSTSIEVGSTETLTATVAPNDASNKTVNWTTSDSNIATVNGGVVTAVGKGSATITATTVDGGYTATCSVTVTAPSSVTFTAGTDVGTTSGNTTPDSVSKKGITMSGSDAAFATAEYRYYQGSTLTFTSTIGNMSKIEFTGDSSKKMGNISVASGSSGSVAISGNDATWTGDASTVEFEFSAQNRAVEVVVSIKSTEKSVTLDNTAITLFTTNTDGIVVTATVENVASPTYSWSASNANVTLVNSTTNAVTIKPNTQSDASSVVTLTVGGTTPNLTATVDVTISVPGPGQTIGTPYTVAQARAAIDAGTGVTGVYATGIVSEIVTAYSSQYHNVSFNISADGSTTSDQLEAYHCGGADAEFVSVGDTVIVYGNLQKYNDTYEFGGGSEIVSRTSPWGFDRLELVTSAEYSNVYYKDSSFTPDGLTVNYVEVNSNTSAERETDVTAEATWNVDLTSTGSKTLSATFGGHTTNSISIIVVEKPSYDIAFGNADGSVKIDSTSVTGNDWTITTTFSGDESFTQNAAYSQVGSSSKPASTITFTKTISSVVTIKDLLIDLGGFNGTAGDITLEVGSTTVGTGSLNGSSDVEVSASSHGRGTGSSTVITITISNISKGVKVYGIAYTAKTDAEMVSEFITDYMHMSHTTNDGSCTSEGWYAAAKIEYGKLHDDQKSLFNTDSTYADAKARLIAWAAANGETFNPATYTFASNSPAKALLANVVGENTNTVAIIVIISLVSVTAIGGYFFIKRRQEN